VNFDALDQAEDDLAFRYEIDRVQPVMHGRCKLFETINHKEQLALTSIVAP
jgi:hypothetical protein